MDAYKINNRLYWTSGDIAALYAENVDPETGEVSEQFPVLLTALVARQEENKDDAINEIKTRSALNEARKAEIARIRADIDRDSKVIEFLKTALNDVLGGEKYASAVGSVSYRHSKALEIADNARLTQWAQDNALDIFTHPAPVISKTAVTELLNDGVSVPYAEIVERVSVIVK